MAGIKKYTSKEIRFVLSAWRRGYREGQILKRFRQLFPAHHLHTVRRSGIKYVWSKYKDDPEYNTPIPQTRPTSSTPIREQRKLQHRQQRLQGPQGGQLVANTQIPLHPPLADSLYPYAHDYLGAALKNSPDNSYAVPDTLLPADDLAMAIQWPTDAGTSDTYHGAPAYSFGYASATPSPPLAANLWSDTNLNPQLQTPTTWCCGGMGYLCGGITPSLPGYISQFPVPPRVIESTNF